MPTHLYCLLNVAAAEDASADAHGIVGIGGSSVRQLRSGQGPDAIEAWVSTVSGDERRAGGAADTAALALAHNAVVDAALATGRTPLPARFGQRFPDDAACMADVVERAPSLRALLERVAGCVEMRVLVAANRSSAIRAAPHAELAPYAGAPNAGRRYLESVRARILHDEHATAEAVAVLDRVSALVRPFVREEAKRTQAQDLWSLSHLVRRESVHTYRSVVSAMPVAEHLRLIVSGPHGPYSFVAGFDMSRIGHDSSSLIIGD